MQTEQTAKQQIVEKIKNSTNILVTVGNNPSVDSLSAALSLTMMLSRLDKHATAVFSGEMPPAISFLEPDKTFENTVDSLRDFIIALDKEKADRLRYKVENDVVRIFITPYKTVISEKDLRFSQGDFNVELIIALGVEKREDLDTAITAHGRILHDATVMTINADKGEASLGSVDWTDTSASSLCEMLMSLSEALQSGLLDQQIATAVLTGIVAATDRFRNEHTTPRVMTMAAQLMAAGANQQLIAAKLEEGHALPEPSSASTDAAPLSDGTSQKAERPSEAKQSKKDDGALEIEHEAKADAAPLPDPSAEALQEAEAELAQSLQATTPAAPTLSVDDLRQDLSAAADDVAAAADTVEESVAPSGPQIKKERRTWRADPAAAPTFGGTLNATTSEAEEAKRQEELAKRNQELLSHDGEADQPATEPAPEPVAPADVPSVPVFEPTPVAEAPQSPPMPEPMPEPETPQQEPRPLEGTEDAALSFEPAPIQTPEPTLADLDAQTRGKAAEDARAAVDAALSAMPFDPAGQPLEGAGAQPGIELRHDAAPAVEEPASPAPTAPPALPAEPAGLPPLPDFSTLPPLPGEQPPVAPPVDQGPLPTDPSATPQTPPMPPQAPPNDPGQFKIPGQQ